MGGSLAPNWPWLPDELDLWVAEAECSPSSLRVRCSAPKDAMNCSVIGSGSQQILLGAAAVGGSRYKTLMFLL